MSVLPFLTSWDPTDLPGMSLDPLGFDRSYAWLADLIVPGLTNVARQPRYFSLLCAGALLGAGEEPAPTPTRKDIDARQDAILRLERLWALGHALIARQTSEFSAGVRGVTYANAHLAELERRKSHSTSTKFKLLLSQSRYGVLGIYANVGGGLRLLDRGSLTLTPDFGERLGTHFIEATGLPDSVRCAVIDDSERAEVPLAEIETWVQKAGVGVTPGSSEADLLESAFNEHERRSRFGVSLAKLKWKADETELAYLLRLEQRFPKDDLDLREVARAIQGFEACYRWSALVLERLMWRGRQETSVPVGKLLKDPVLIQVASELPKAVGQFFADVDGAESGALLVGAERATDLRRFLADVREAGGDIRRLIEVVLNRHTDVQRGKFERNRPKSPWIEIANERLQLTMARSNQVNGEPTSPSGIAPHEYRLTSARALLLAREGRA
jgi:hypothetical protein